MENGLGSEDRALQDTIPGDTQPDIALPSSQSQEESDAEEDYHTAQSGSSDMETAVEHFAEEGKDNPANIEVEDVMATHASDPPLLPLELLQPRSRPAYAPSIPRGQMTRKDKRAERNRSRKIKKLGWEKLRAEAGSNGVLAAGRVAQRRRGVAASGGRVRSGRVQKSVASRTSQSQISGRQALVEDRRRTIKQNKTLPRSVKKENVKPRR